MRNFITLLISYCYRAFWNFCAKIWEKSFWKTKPEMGDNITLGFKEIDFIDVDWAACT
jgi:hypothetical protein